MFFVFFCLVGDLVIGRILSVENKRWKAEVLARRDAILQLSAVSVLVFILLVGAACHVLIIS